MLITFQTEVNFSTTKSSKYKLFKKQKQLFAFLKAETASISFSKKKVGRTSIRFSEILDKAINAFQKEAETASISLTKNINRKSKN